MDKTIIDRFTSKNGDSIVLCSIHDDKHYVTWACNSTFTDFFWGHYFQEDLESAKKDFIKRCSEC